MKGFRHSPESIEKMKKSQSESVKRRKEAGLLRRKEVHKPGKCEGGRSHFAKMNEANVIEIKRLRVEENKSITELMKQFNMSRTGIWGIISGKTWKHLFKKQEGGIL